MDIMNSCDIIPFQWPRKEKERKNTSKDLLYPNTLSHTSPQNVYYAYLCSKKIIPSIGCDMSLHSKSYFFLLCNLKLMGK
jgi:hypothetical protein